MTRHAVERQIAADHPAAVGHFPGNPIVPGAVILDEVIAAIAGRSIAAFEVVSAKFLNKVRPGERLVIQWDETQEGEIRFTCSVGSTDRPVAAGSLRFAAPR